jgi:hypothetical protein
MGGGRVPPPQASHVQRIPQQVVRPKVVVGVGVVTLHPLVNCQAQDGSADGRPLRLGQGHRGEVVGEDGGSGHLVSFELRSVYRVRGVSRGR